MSFSANEIAALAQKAARGAGFPPAQSEAFGRAAALHLGAGRSSDVLMQALEDPQDSPILRLPLLMDDVLRAVALSGPQVSLSLHDTDGALAVSYARLLPMRLELCQISPGDGSPDLLTLVVDAATPSRPALPARIEAPKALMEHLTALAARTYVPASAASRSAGAGAGNIDND